MMDKKKTKFTIPSVDSSNSNTNEGNSRTGHSLFQRYKEERKNTTKEPSNQLDQRRRTDDDNGVNNNFPRDNHTAIQPTPSTETINVKRSKEQSQPVASTSNSGDSCVGEKRPIEAPKVFKGATFAETFSYLKESEFYEEPPEKLSSNKDIDVQQPKYKANSIIVNPRQRGNPILKHIRNVPWEYGDIFPDYVMGQTTCALFLSLRYYNFNPDYIHERLKQLGSRYDLRVLLVQVDVKDCQHALRELGKIAILADCTLILAWSAEEAGRYLETYKAYENKPADVLQERVEGDYLSKMTDCLTSVKSVNKTDVITLLSTFGSLKSITDAEKDEIALCPGFGLQKAERLHKIFQEPFKKRKRKSQGEDTESTEKASK